ncbi:MAG: M20/M25/M40 family metallo-hydrolase, partial [Nanoarchaeota archaeon]
MKKFIENEIKNLLLDLKKITLTSSPSYYESDRIALIKKILFSIGYEGQIDDVGNLIYTINGKKSKQVVFSAHTDTVFNKDTKLEIIEKNGKYYCPGVCDNSLGIVSMIYLMKYIKENVIVPKYNTTFLFNVCEEGLGNLKGIRHFFDNNNNNNLIAHFAIEGHKLGRLTSKVVGSIRRKIKIKTKGGHSWRDFGSKNAINVISEMISKFNKIELPKEPKTTFNIGIIKGGSS